MKTYAKNLCQRCGVDKAEITIALQAGTKADMDRVNFLLHRVENCCRKGK
jgi:hypothetical protein